MYNGESKSPPMPYKEKNAQGRGVAYKTASWAAYPPEHTPATAKSFSEIKYPGGEVED